MPIRRLSSRVVYENRWMRVREDEIEHADGSPGIFGVVEKPDFALIIPREDDGALWLVEQERYPVGARYWEFPQGSWEQTPGADPLELARGELREETGLEAGSMRRLGNLYEAYGYCDQAFDVWLASNLTQGTPTRSSEEQDMRAKRVSGEEWKEMVQGGAVKDGPSLAAFALLLLDAPGGGYES
jgi:NUDIX domain-containing protein